MRTAGSRLARAVIGIVLLGAAPMVVGGPAEAAPDPGPRLTHTELNKRLMDMLRKGATDTQIRADLGLKKVSTTPPGFRPQSTSGSVLLWLPYVFQEENSDEYVVVEKVKWHNLDMLESDPSVQGRTPGHNDVGGLDGIAVRTSRAVLNSGVPEAYYCSEAWKVNPEVSPPNWDPYGCTKTTDYWDNSESGVSIKFQDRYYFSKCGGTDYVSCGIGNSFQVTLFFWFLKSPGCVQVFGSYAHTWKKTSITGFNVSTTGFGVSWRDEGNNWQKTSVGAAVDCYPPSP